MGSYGFFYLCVLIDNITYPTGVPAGGGWVGAGWILMIFTVPICGILGGVAGFAIPYSLFLKKEKKQKREFARTSVQPIHNETKATNQTSDIYK
jgi:hypothetical protein